jgi:hypothetical protein
MKLFEMEVELGEGIPIGGLTVFPLIGNDLGGSDYLTGSEALETALIEVGELDPPQVPFLQVNNIGDEPVLLIEGEILIGADQNRTTNVTVLCPPRARTVIPVTCVEAGRWGRGARRSMKRKSKSAPGSLRAGKTARLSPRSHDVTDRRSDQGMVWAGVSGYETAHGAVSDTSALDDVQEKVEERIAPDLDRLVPERNQVGLVCTIGDDVVGMDLFDHAATLAKYLRSIVAGHALDATSTKESVDPIGAIERFLTQVDVATRENGEGVGLGEELLLRGQITGVGLKYEGHLVHIGAFPGID